MGGAASGAVYASRRTAHHDCQPRSCREGASAASEATLSTLTLAQVARVATHGRLRRIAAGEVLVESGQINLPFFVVAEGRIEVARPSQVGDTLIGAHGPGSFTGEATMLSGRPGLARVRTGVALDEGGFVMTGPALTPGVLASARWPLAREPHLLETSVPGVFAVGDVRAGSTKRVASVVGEGSIAVSLIHGVLREQ